MEGSTPALLARRLDRLRSVSAGAPPQPRTETRSRAAPVGHAARLAAALGGRAEGPVVLHESEHDVRLDGAQLDSLPLPIRTAGELLFLDLETTGLATGPGTLAFLVGLGWWVGEGQAARLIVRQLLLPDHADEPALLDAISAALPGGTGLVTYNGRCFDWPLLVARYRMHRRAAPPIGAHHDLLPLTRQLWRSRLGNARLATVEAAICDVSRDEDLPGALIPQRYFDYLRDRRPEPLRVVMQHNRQDIVSLAQLLSAMARLAADRDLWPHAHPSDLAGLAGALARRQRLTEALDCIDAALASPAWQRGLVGGGPIWRRLATDRARLLGRLGRREEQALAWLAMARRGGPGAAAAWLQVARHREHRLRDVAGALDACREAAAAADRARLWGRTAPAVERDLAHRLARLRRRLANVPAGSRIRPARPAQRVA